MLSVHVLTLHLFLRESLIEALVKLKHHAGGVHVLPGVHVIQTMFAAHRGRGLHITARNNYVKTLIRSSLLQMKMQQKQLIQSERK